ncbi:MAG: 30S ribosomal protein S4 [Nitrospira bacterium SG8_35_1]|nr:MAG: 30S ribosomal protein S4 [Nitrospira bacterium SG8_35_1]UCE71300.1 MAG: 30S ribosomal protein S4 [Nitrospiraceae bacterium]UCH44957.1 MAG: 30S ribosomal protein S4 [Nitrospiraceae bacterium]
MARYRDALCRLCRRESEKLFLKGDRCYTDKCAVERRKYPPGQHGQRRRKFSDYALQLREKQKAKETYGVLEKQFKRYFYMADKRTGVTGDNLLQLLERRLDNVVYRLGLASNRRQARQLVLHGHINLNGRRVNIPSCLVRPGDIVSIMEGSKKLHIIEENVSKIEHRGLPGWVEMDVNTLSGKVLHNPARDEIMLPVQEQLIVELYSK